MQLKVLIPDVNPVIPPSPIPVMLEVMLEDILSMLDLRTMAILADKSKTLFVKSFSVPTIQYCAPEKYQSECCSLAFDCPFIYESA